MSAPVRKRIMFLGGSHFQLPPISYAKQQGHYVITCDYLPDNPGHKIADEYHNVSTTDKDSILELAIRLQIHGIVAYASDPASPTAAYVAEKLNLTGNPYQSVQILARKDLFRDFLQKNSFNVPRHAAFKLFIEAKEFFISIKSPVMIKPVDSSGSKGVYKVSNIDQLFEAFNSAMSFSRAGMIIIEEYIERKGYQIAGDGFVLNERLVFRCFAQEHFNSRGNLYVPIGESFPLLLPEEIQLRIHSEIDRLMKLLNMKAGALNFDIVIDNDEDIYLMEIGPRSGGNLISEIIHYSTGVNLAKYVVDIALGLDCGDLFMYQKAEFYSCYILHSQDEGYFKGISIDKEIQQNIVEKNIFVQPGDKVNSFDNSSFSLGLFILKFNSPAEMLKKMDNMSSCVHIILENDM